jgi:SH3-like domain-containing protein
MIRRTIFPLFLLATMLAADPAGSQPAGVTVPLEKKARPAAGKGGVTGLPLPRFVSLRSGKVNLRTGPGSRYPVEWVLVYRHMPVEIIAEFDTWRKVRDWQGTVGWIHQSMISGRRWAIVREGRQPLRRAADAEARIVARIERKVIGQIEQCREGWCEIDFSGFKGWVRDKQVWGVYPGEKVD